MNVDKPATANQVEYCKKLFRKSKLYYNCLDDDKLIEEVKANTGFDLLNLTHSEVQRIVAKLKPEAARQRMWINR